MRRWRETLAGAISFLAVGIAIWLGTTLYPRLWWKASFEVGYSNKWPISEPDFATAMSLVKQELDWGEIITCVDVTRPDEIEITSSKSAPLVPVVWAGRVFMVRKVNGQWAIARRVWRLDPT